MESAPPISTPKFVSPALTAEAMPCIYYSNQDSMVNIQLDGLSIESAPPIFTPEFVSPALTAEAMTYVYYSNLEEFRTEEDAWEIFGPNLSTSYLQLSHQIQWSIYSLMGYL